MIGIIDYGAGNVGNVRRALTRLDRESLVFDSVNDPCIGIVDGLILPGVGSFSPAMGNLISRGWYRFIQEWISSGRPVLGICLGMQLLSEGSEENGFTKGFGIFKGIAVKIRGSVKLPHIGWNTVDWINSDLFSEKIRGESDHFYFVHSYALPISSLTAATTSLDGTIFTSVAARGRTVGFQFHPERSGPVGLRLLERTLEGMGV